MLHSGDHIKLDINTKSRRAMCILTKHPILTPLTHLTLLHENIVVLFVISNDTLPFIFPDFYYRTVTVL